MNKTKKGFTLVELLVVIAILAILAVVAIIGYSSYTKKAKLSNDISLVSQINEVLRSSEALGEVPRNMYEAKELIEDKTGYDISKSNTILTEYVYIGYDVKANCVVLINDLSNQNTSETIIECPTGYTPYSTYDIFVPMNDVYDNIYSTYLVDTNKTTFETNKGIDVGDCKGITLIEYENNGESRDTIIRTNSATTNLLVNSPLDNVSHYGSAGVVNIQKISTSSFYEYGSVAYIEFAIGRIVLTKTSDVEIINVSKKDSNTYNNPIIADGGVLDENMPEIISRDQIIVTDQRGKTELVQIQILDSNGNIISSDSEQVYAYANGAVGTTEKISTGSNIQNETISSDLGLIVLDSGSHAGEKAYGDSKKNEVITESVNKSLDLEVLESTNYVVRVDETGYTTLSEAFKHTTDGCTVRLLKNTTMFYTIQINNSLTFNLNGKTLTINSAAANEEEVAAVGDWNPIVSTLFDVANGVDLIVNGNGTITTSSTNSDWQSTLVLFNYVNSETTCSLTIENGTYNIYGSILAIRKNCTGTINGGTFNETKTSTGTNLFMIHGGTLVFNNGNVNIGNDTAAFYLYSSSLTCTCTINDINLTFTGSNSEVIGYCGGDTYFYINGGNFYIGDNNIFDHYSDELTELLVSGGSFDVKITEDKYTYDPDFRHEDIIQSGKSLVYNETTQMYVVE